MTLDQQKQKKKDLQYRHPKLLPSLASPPACHDWQCQHLYPELYPRPQRNMREWWVYGSPQSSSLLLPNVLLYFVTDRGLIAGAVLVLAAAAGIFLCYSSFSWTQEKIFLLFSCISFANFNYIYTLYIIFPFSFFSLCIAFGLFLVAWLDLKKCCSEFPQQCLETPWRVQNVAMTFPSLFIISIIVGCCTWLCRRVSINCRRW